MCASRSIRETTHKSLYPILSEWACRCRCSERKDWAWPPTQLYCILYRPCSYDIGVKLILHRNVISQLLVHHFALWDKMSLSLYSVCLSCGWESVPRWQILARNVIQPDVRLVFITSIFLLSFLKAGWSRCNPQTYSVISQSWTPLYLLTATPEPY